ncbi:site-2 protease family protein [Chamaesiphon sp. VAR_48_metabat_135_sub]|uniref:site-2 protease family protein n=1 Tax=Chamaesiphon sp. VAR_48_metabat_135_sub TaxID=2964699 RepID=UPI00286A929E|nr:site-2 protease family protein [Chamaesiphon sp. VAR_48_metabat_135_sub]
MTTAGNTTTIALLLITLGILGWGYYRNRDLGKFGVLSWLQSAVLMIPWLLSFGALSAGLYINLAGVLLLLVVSSGLYIWLGSRVRLAAQDPETAVKIADRLAKSRSKQSGVPTETGAQALSIAMDALNIPEADLSSIKGIFGIDTFYSTETIAYQQGAIFKGNLRGDAAVVHRRLTEKLHAKVGDKYRLFLVPDPEERPVVVVLPSTNDPQPATVGQQILGVVMFIATIATSLEAMGVFLGFDFYEHTDRIKEVLPLSLGIWTILISHELGHQILARMRQVKIGLPFFLPTGQIGAFGAITRFESLIPNRSVLFDVALAGPACGGLVSLLMLVVGLLLSHSGGGLEIPAQFLQGSILVGTLAKIVLGATVHQASISIHPLVVIGWLGLVINALNLMPAGQLDGGRIVQAIYGRKTAQRSTLVTLVILGFVAFFNPANLVILYWLILVGFLQRALERPSLDEITEPNDARAALGLLALFLMAATVIPFSPDLAGKLGIGG